jgi:hypothetical protein
MFERVDRLHRELSDIASSLDPRLIEARDASGLLETVAKMEHLLVAVKTICTRRVAETRVWADEGDRSAAHWLARTTGTTVGEAVGMVETARRLEELPETEAALRGLSVGATGTGGGVGRCRRSRCGGFAAASRRAGERPVVARDVSTGEGGKCR